MKKILLFTALVLMLSACLPQNVQMPQSPLLSTLERKSGLIAYIGLDGNVHVADQGGGHTVQVTDDAVITPDENGELNFYQYPTWSLDGTQLAFVGTRGTNAQSTASIYVADVETDAVTEIYASETELPFYLYWSPDDENVSFLSTSVSGQSLILQSAPAAGGERTIIDTGSPYYWSWAPDGNTLITHSGGASTSTTPEHIAFIELDESELVEDGFLVSSASFQAPAWSPDGSHILLTRLEEGKREIIVTDQSGAYEQTLGEFELNTAFAWSSDSQKVAFINGAQAMNAGVVGSLNVVDLATSETISTEENVYAFFWSPDGDRLAYFVPFLYTDPDNPDAGQQFLLQLQVLDVQTGESKELFTYQPTQQFASILPYFDQYHQSNTIWSPDNNNLVLSFLDTEGRPGIAVVAASGQLEPRILAQGYLAFWSWK